MKLLLQSLLFTLLTFNAKSQKNIPIKLTDSIVSSLDKANKFPVSFYGIIRFDTYTLISLEDSIYKISHRGMRNTYDLTTTYYVKDSTLLFVRRTGYNYFLKLRINAKYYFENNRIIKYEDPDLKDANKLQMEMQLFSDFKRTMMAYYRFLSKNGV